MYVNMSVAQKEKKMLVRMVGSTSQRRQSINHERVVGG